MTPKKSLTLGLAAFTFSLVLFGSSLVAQTIVYDFNDKPGSVAASTPSVVAPGYASSISLTSGHPDKTSATGSFIQWQSHPVILTTNRYLQISISNENSPFTLTNFAFTPKSFSASKSAKIEVRFSTKSGTDFDTDSVTIWSSVTRHTSSTEVSIALTDPAILSTIQNITTGYFRIYTFDTWDTTLTDGAGANDGLWLGVDDIKITAASPIPEPSTAAALLGVVVIASAVGFRRSRGAR